MIRPECPECAERGQYACRLHGLKATIEPANRAVRSRLKAKSRNQEARDNGWLRAIVYCQLLAQKDGYRCEGCWQHVSDDIVEALQILQPCHKTPRKDGEGVRFYDTGKLKHIGLDTFDNIYPGCADCNLKDHYQDRSNPEFSRSVRDLGRGKNAGSPRTADGRESSPRPTLPSPARLLLHLECKHRVTGDPEDEHAASTYCPGCACEQPIVDRSSFVDEEAV